MIETRRIKTAPGLVFDVSVGGAEDAPLVLMLHGFCVSRHFWSNQLPALAAAGYFAVAPNQRGYSADARPDPTDFDSYRVDRLIGDALDIVTEPAMASGASISSAMTGAAASPGLSPTGIPRGSAH